MSAGIKSAVSGESLPFNLPRLCQGILRSSRDPQTWPGQGSTRASGIAALTAECTLNYSGSVCGAWPDDSSIWTLCFCWGKTFPSSAPLVIKADIGP